MARNDYQQLPDKVLEIKRQTEELIRLADRTFLKQCGITWEEDMEQTSSLP
jgi:hypothetical protein